MKNYAKSKIKENLYFKRKRLVLSQTYIIVTFLNSSSSDVLRYVNLHVSKSLPYSRFSNDVTKKFKLINYREVLLTALTNFRFERVLRFAIDDD